VRGRSSRSAAEALEPVLAPDAALHLRRGVQSYRRDRLAALPTGAVLTIVKLGERCREAKPISRLSLAWIASPSSAKWQELPIVRGHSCTATTPSRGRSRDTIRNSCSSRFLMPSLMLSIVNLPAFTDRPSQRHGAAGQTRDGFLASESSRP